MSKDEITDKFYITETELADLIRLSTNQRCVSLAYGTNGAWLIDAQENEWAKAHVADARKNHEQ